MQKGMQKQRGKPTQNMLKIEETPANKQNPPATSICKVLLLFSVVVRISVLQLGQIVQIGSGPAIWAISILKVYQTKFSDFLILKLNADFDIEPINAKWQYEMAK